MKLVRNDFDRLKQIIEHLNQQHTNQKELPSFEVIENDFLGIELPPGVYELIDINSIIKQKHSVSSFTGIEFIIDADTISVKTILTTSNSTLQFSEDLTSF